jgi:archaeal flagellar protein FlaJ
MKFEPWTIAYTYLNKRLESIYPQFQELRILLKKGGVLVAYRAYVAFMVLMSIVSFIIAIPVSIAVLALVGIPFLSVMNIALTFGISSSTALVTFLILYIYPGIKASNRRSPIEKNLPYIANFLTLLSSSNVPPSVIFQSISKIDTVTEARYEFSNIIRDIEIFGKDLLTSIQDNARLIAADQLGELLMGYVAAIKTGGNQTEYLKITTEKITKERILKLDVMLESLSAIAEIYIMLLVASPLLFAVLFVTLGMIGSGSIAGFSMGTLLYLLVYLAIPIMGAIVMVIISTLEK